MAKGTESEKPHHLHHGGHGGHSRRKSAAGTIDMLIENRRRASDEHTRAERAYRARKNATIARATLRETKEHFSEGFSHLRQGFAGLFAVVKAAPYLIGEKREAWRRRGEMRRRAEALALREEEDGGLPGGRRRESGGSGSGSGSGSSRGGSGSGSGSEVSVGGREREKEEEDGGRRKSARGWLRSG